MRCARPTPPRTTRATVRCGSSLSPPVTSLAAALTAALVAEPASRPAGKHQPTLLHEQEPPAVPRGLFYFVQQPSPARVFISTRRSRRQPLESHCGAHKSGRVPVG